MTPIIGLLIAVIAGLIAPRPRGVIGIVIPPMLGATAAQSWFLATGRGHNRPATTTDSPAYWVVQLIIITGICGVAAAVCRIRTRRGASNLALPTGSERSVLLAAAVVAAFAATLGLMFITDHPKHPGSGAGNIPISGAIAVAVGLAALLVVGVAWTRRTHQSARI